MSESNERPKPFPYWSDGSEHEDSTWDVLIRVRGGVDFTVEVDTEERAQELARLPVTEWERDRAVEILRGIQDVVDESRGVSGWHQNGDVMEWGECPDIVAMREFLAEIDGKEGGDD